MPELPEVEHGRRLVERVALGRRIKRVSTADDPIVFDGASPGVVERALTGRVVLAVRRHGKYIWLELDRRPWPLFHFGMTGAFRAPNEVPLELESKIAIGDPAWPPRFTKIHFWIEGGGELVMTNARRLGRIRLRQDPETEPPLSELGFDPLLDMPSTARFVSLARRRRAPIKAVLLDQGFAAGVGNWMADEILYQSEIDPRRLAAELDDRELARIRRVLARVVKKSVAVNAVKSGFPPSWLFHRRWGKERGATTLRGEPIEHIVVAGRTTAWVPSTQR
jgi:formamidopyrimidine-DNA glycosylase